MKEVVYESMYLANLSFAASIAHHVLLASPMVLLDISLYSG